MPTPSHAHQLTLFGLEALPLDALEGHSQNDWHTSGWSRSHYPQHQQWYHPENPWVRAIVDANRASAHIASHTVGVLWHAIKPLH